MSIDQMRKTYSLAGIDATEMSADPIDQFRIWFGEAQADDLPEWLEVNAMTLATADSDGKVTSRIVLLKGIEEGRFVFFTNYESEKGNAIEGNPRVNLNFFWPHVERQVRIDGVASRTTRERSRSYFHSRPRDSQIGAWVSQQSRAIDSRVELEKRFTELSERYLDPSQPIPIPDYWGGYEVEPSRVEFWQGRPSRLHDRIVYQHENDQWIRHRLSP